MKCAQIFSLAIGLAAVAAVASADTITSTPTGGPWSDSTTWVGGVVPDDYDDVVIVGHVEIAGSAACKSLSVLALGSVRSAPSAPNTTLQVTGAVTNAGTIADGAYNFQLRVGGDLHNDGTWTNSQLTIIGTDDRQLSHGPATGFTTDFAFDSVASGDLIATTPLSVTGNVDLTGSRLILQPDCPFTLDSGRFSGGLLAGGNEMRFVSWSYLDWCTIDDVVLVGEVEAATAVTFTTRVTVMGILQNGTGGGGANIEGDLINHGVIRNDNYSFLVSVSGDIENHGAITNPQLELMGVGTVHHLSMGPDAVLDASVFLPEFQASTLVADTPVSFDRGLGLGVGTLILEPGAALHFSQNSGLGSGTVEANGNTITTEDGNSGLSYLTIDRGVFGDYVAVYGDILLTDGVTVTGTLASWPWAAADLNVEGLLRNEGTIRDGDYPVRLTLMNDLENLGVMENARVVLAGTVDQAVGAGPGISVPEFVLESGLDAAGYQWYRDGAMLPGETGPSLTLDSVGAADYGRYHCVGDDQISRAVFITEVLNTTDVPGAGRLALEQNHPNPFNPTTNIAFSLDRAGPVSLAVYDIAGHEVDRLVGGELGAGRHVVAWQPRGLASGTYVYRLRADGVDVSRKCSLLK